MKDKNHKLLINHTKHILEITNHSHRVSQIAKELAKDVGLTDIECDMCGLSGHFHDIGKFYVDQDILHKNGKLSEVEYTHIKSHVTFSTDLVRGLPFTNDIADIVEQHHENFDGTGYPYGLKEQEIHICARVLKIADVYDSLTSDRPYRKGHRYDVAITIMDKEINTFDFKVYKIFKEKTLKRLTPQLIEVVEHQKNDHQVNKKLLKQI